MTNDNLEMIVQGLLSPQSVTCLPPGFSLKELASQWCVINGDKNIILFWQTVIKMTISLHCQRYGLVFMKRFLNWRLHLRHYISPRKIWDQALCTPGLTQGQIARKRRKFVRLCKTGMKM
jgi:hypothetical protein